MGCPKLSSILWEIIEYIIGFGGGYGHGSWKAWGSMMSILPMY